MWVPKTCVTLCDLGVFAEQAAEPVTSEDAHARHGCGRILAPGRRLLVQRPVRPMRVVARSAVKFAAQIGGDAPSRYRVLITAHPGGVASLVVSIVVSVGIAARSRPVAAALRAGPLRSGKWPGQAYRT